VPARAARVRPGARRKGPFFAFWEKAKMGLPALRPVFT